MTNLVIIRRGVIMVNQVRILVYHLTITDACSVTCPQLAFYVSLIHFNTHKRHVLYCIPLLNIISNKQFGDIISFIEDPLNTLPLFSYRGETKNAINEISSFALLENFTLASNVTVDI